MRWILWVTKTHTGDLAYVVGDYSNKGHAIAKLRGLRRKAWLAGSEINYTIRQG